MSAPLMIPETVEDVSVEWLLQNLASSIEFPNHDDDGDVTGVDWFGMMTSKACDYQFGDLCYVIEHDGFNVPVCVTLESCVWTSYRPAPMLGNGHHRMTAAILLCLDTIKVYWEPSDEFMASHATDAEPLGSTPWAGRLLGYGELL